MTGGKHRLKPGIESLEDRCIPTSAHLSGGVLDIVGTARSHAIVVRLVGSNQRINGVRRAFRAHAVHQIEIHAGPGDQLVDIDPRLVTPAFVLCGPGNCLVLGDAGDDTVVSAGPVRFIGRGGHNVVNGVPDWLAALNPLPPPAPASPAPAPLGPAIAAEALSLIGQPKVPPGQCTDLVQKVLRDNGADANAGVNGTNAEGDPNYTWGTLVYSQTGPSPVSGRLTDVLPGDVIQFADVVVPGTNGLTWTAAHHTAVVVANPGNGDLQVVQQNIGNDPNIESAVMEFGRMTQGTIWVYRAQHA
jgi:hypothetical protein